jgi:hypothetical protein
VTGTEQDREGSRRARLKESEKVGEAFLVKATLIGPAVP